MISRNEVNFSELALMDINNPIRQVLSQHGEVRFAILFGSQASGQARPQSDVDLAVLLNAPMSAKDKMSLISDLSALCGLPIDLVDLRVAGEPLLGQILKHGIRLLGTDSDYAELIKRHLFDEADFLPYRKRILAERRHAWIGK